jgi:hypothetical protein
VTDTCTVDYYLLSFWILPQIDTAFTFKIPKLQQTDSLISIINNIEKGNWNKAKEIWIVNIMKYSSEQKIISLFGSEENMMFGYLIDYQLHKLIQFMKQIAQKTKK